MCAVPNMAAFCLLLLLLLQFHLYARYLQLPETNHVSRVYSAAAVLNLQFVLHAMLFRMLNMFSTFTYYYYY